MRPPYALVLLGLLTLSSSSKFAGAHGKGDEQADISVKGGEQRISMPRCPGKWPAVSQPLPSAVQGQGAQQLVTWAPPSSGLQRALGNSVSPLALAPLSLASLNCPLIKEAPGYS